MPHLCQPGYLSDNGGHLAGMKDKVSALVAPAREGPKCFLTGPEAGRGECLVSSVRTPAPAAHTDEQ